MHDPARMTPPDSSSSPGDPGVQGIAFTLEGVDDSTFSQILRDLRTDPAFARPLQVQAQPPQPGRSARLTLVFHPADRGRAVGATQRLKTVLLRYGVQVDTVHVPGV